MSVVDTCSCMDYANEQKPFILNHSPILNPNKKPLVSTQAVQSKADNCLLHFKSNFMVLLLVLLHFLNCPIFTENILGVR